MLHKRISLSVIVASLLLSTFVGCGSGEGTPVEELQIEQKVQASGKVSLAKAVVSKNIIEEGDSVNYNVKNALTSDGFSYEWRDADNRMLSTKNSFNVAYDEKGTHKATLTVFDKVGKSCVSEVVVKVVEKKVEPTSNKKPIAKIETSGSEISQGDEVTFSASSSSDSDGSIVKYEWRNCCGVLLSNEPSFKHSFDEAGSTKIKLTVVDDKGLCASIFTTIKVKSLPNDAPVAVAGDDQVIAEGETVVFDASSSSDSDGEIGSYEWRLNGCIISKSAQFEKSDFVAGNYELELTVIDNMCAKATDMIKIIVNPQQQGNQAPIAKAKVNFTSAPEGTEIIFDGSQSSDFEGDVASYEWKDGDTVLGSEKIFKTKLLIVGKHAVTLTVTDSDGMVAMDSVEVTIEDILVETDTTKPIISIDGSATVNLTVGESYTDAGAFANDNKDGNITSSITKTGTVDTNTDATYTIKYNVSDEAGNKADEVTRIVIVKKKEEQKDTTKPVITLKESATRNLTVGDSYTDAGATASDNKDGNITSKIVKTGTVDTSKAKTYTIKYNVSDEAGNKADEVTRTVIVKEKDKPNTPPIANSQSVSTNQDQVKVITLTAKDDDGDALTYRVTKNSAHGAVLFSENKVTYTPTTAYSGTDSFEFKVNDGKVDSVAATVSINIQKKEVPNAAPIAKAGAVQTTIESGAKISLLGSGTDDGEIVSYRWSGPNGYSRTEQNPFASGFNSGGPYTFTLTVTDDDGKTGTDTVVITIKKKEVPKEAPKAKELTIQGTAKVGNTLTANFTYSDKENDPKGSHKYQWLRNGSAIGGATSKTYKLTDADAEKNITFKVTPVSTKAPTTGVAVTSGAVTVAKKDVPAENKPPKAKNVKILGATTRQVGDVLEGSYEYFDVDGDLEGNSMIRWMRGTSYIDGATSKKYTLTQADEGKLIRFSVKPYSQNGNAGPGGSKIGSSKASEGVMVSENNLPEADTTAPIIALKGDATIYLTVGEPYIERGATASDDIDADFDATIKSSDVDTTKAGTYHVVYTATDKANNVADNVTRTVKVKATSAPEADTTAPIIALKGDATIYLTVGEPYIERGATASDDIDADFDATIKSSDVDTTKAGTYHVVYTATDKANNVADNVTRTVKVEVGKEI